MALKLTVTNVVEATSRLWEAQMAPAEIRRLGDARSSRGARSVIGVQTVEFDPETNSLLVELGTTQVLNVGTTDEVVFVDLSHCSSGSEAVSDLQLKRSSQEIHEPGAPPADNDAAFLTACGEHLEPGLVNVVRNLLNAIRSKYAGNLLEGQARKWVNHPSNFVALTIQNRDQSIAVHVKGNPGEISAPSLDIRRDRPGYSRFKVSHMSQLEDAIKVIFYSAEKG